MNIKAVKTRLIVKKTERKKATESGILLASGLDSDEEQYAEVLSVGSEVKEDIEVGDSVIPNWSLVGVIKHNGQALYVCNEADLFGVVKKNG